MHYSPPGPAANLPIDKARIDSAKGSWLIAVQSVVETLAGSSLLVGIILEQNRLEQNGDEENLETRRLELIADSVAAREPENCLSFADRIRVWIESTEGDGFLDLTVV